MSQEGAFLESCIPQIHTINWDNLNTLLPHSQAFHWGQYCWELCHYERLKQNSSLLLSWQLFETSTPHLLHETNDFKNHREPFFKHTLVDAHTCTHLAYPSCIHSFSHFLTKHTTWGHWYNACWEECWQSHTARPSWPSHQNTHIYLHCDEPTGLLSITVAGCITPSF